MLEVRIFVDFSIDPFLSLMSWCLTRYFKDIIFVLNMFFERLVISSN